MIRRALFLDRDGVLNIDHGYVGTPDRFEWSPGALAALRRAKAAGWRVFVVTNQSGIARGYYTAAGAEALHAWIVAQARAAGATIDDWRYCPHGPEDGCACRKPNPGMFESLIEAWDVDPAHSLAIGDKATDLEAAAAAGIPARLFPGGNLEEFMATLGVFG